MAKQSPYFNADGSYSYGKGKPLSQKLNIDPSKLQAREMSKGSSPYIKSQNAKVGGTYPVEFFNDGVGSGANKNFSMVPEGTGLPAKYVANPTIESSQGGGSNLPPRVNTFNAKLVDPNIGRLQDARSAMAALALESLIPSTVMANETEQSLLAEQMKKDGYRPENKPLDYSINPAQEIANINFNDPLMLAMSKQNKPQLPSQAIPQSSPVQSPLSPETPNQMASMELMEGGRMQGYPGSDDARFVNSNGDLHSMIQNYAQEGQGMNAKRDQELMRLLGMRDSMESSLAGKSTFDRMDFSPLAAFVDSATGSKLSQAQKAPASAVDDMNVLSALNDRVSNYTKSKNQEQLALYKTLLDSQYKDEMMDLKLQLAGNKRDPIQDYMSKLAIKQSMELDKGAKISSGDVGRITDQDEALDLLSRVKDSTIQNKAQIGPVTGLARLNPWSDSRNMQAIIDQAKQIIGKGLEGGVLKIEDEKKYAKILPTMNDTFEQVQFKLAEIEKTIRAKKGSLLNNLGKSGYNVSGYKADMAQSSSSGGMNIDKNAIQAALEKRMKP